MIPACIAGLSKNVCAKNENEKHVRKRECQKVIHTFIILERKRKRRELKCMVFHAASNS
jgi:hypothetical protein